MNIKELEKSLKFAKDLFGDDPNPLGKRIIARRRAQLNDARARRAGTGQANDSAQDQNARLAAFYAKQGRGPNQAA